MAKAFLTILTLALSFQLWANERIVNGELEKSGSPIAQTTVLLLGHIQKISFLCTAVVYDDLHLLTAGHCLGGGGYASLIAKFDIDRNGSGEEIPVIHQIRKNENMGAAPEKDWQDIAVLTLARPIPHGYHPPLFSSHVTLGLGQVVRLAGYGKSSPDPDNFEGLGQLRATRQEITNPANGESEFLVSLRGRGSCQGDSGGPAFLEPKAGLLLVGLTSRLAESNRVPGSGNRQPKYGCYTESIFTAVGPFLDWIQAVTQ